MTDPLNKASNLFTKIFVLLLLLVAIWAFGFAAFIVSINQIEHKYDRAEGIVVLTGGLGRIDEGFRVLNSGRGKRLLISGVDRNINNETILSVFGPDQALWDCCVDMGRQATNTRTNALEAAAWARERGFSSLILITSDYHMPRSLRAFRVFARDLEIIPHPVKVGVSPLGLALEYDKYLLNLARIDLKN